MEADLRELKRRIIDISYKYNLSHIGSCMTAVPIIYEIYQTKLLGDKFVLSAGHAGLALYVILEKYEGHNAEELFDKHGVHPDRDPEHGIHVSTGSLGQGLPIATGMALANRNNDVYVYITDGEAHEGSIYETINFIKDQRIENIKIYCNWNGYTAYKTPSKEVNKYLVDSGIVKMRYTQFEFPFLKGLDAHYMKLTEENYKEAKEKLS